MVTSATTSPLNKRETRLGGEVKTYRGWEKTIRRISLLYRDFLDYFSYMCYHIKYQSKGFAMALSYKKLWKLLIDKDMRKEDLRVAAGLTSTAIAKLGRNEDVSTKVLLKICNALDCSIEDIMEIVEDKGDCQ